MCDMSCPDSFIVLYRQWGNFINILQMSLEPVGNNVFSLSNIIEQRAYVYTRGGQTFLFAGQIFKVKYYGRPQKIAWKFFVLYFSFLSQNNANLRCFHKMYVQQTWQCIYNPTHWGPQKILGGLHAARSLATSGIYIHHKCGDRATLSPHL
jgi:hypothetical protein